MYSPVQSSVAWESRRVERMQNLMREVVQLATSPPSATRQDFLAMSCPGWSERRVAPCALLEPVGACASLPTPSVKPTISTATLFGRETRKRPRSSQENDSVRDGDVLDAAASLLNLSPRMQPAGASLSNSTTTTPHLETLAPLGPPSPTLVLPPACISLPAPHSPATFCKQPGAKW
jgi:hypothetical protein